MVQISSHKSTNVPPIVILNHVIVHPVKTKAFYNIRPW